MGLSKSYVETKNDWYLLKILYRFDTIINNWLTFLGFQIVFHYKLEEKQNSVLSKSYA